MRGISLIAPFSMGQPWDLFDLERRFAAAIIAGMAGQVSYQAFAKDSMEAVVERKREEAVIAARVAHAEERERTRLNGESTFPNGFRARLDAPDETIPPSE